MTIFAGPLTRTGKIRRAETPLTLLDETDAWAHMAGRFTISAHWCPDEPRKLQSKEPMVGQDDREDSDFISPFQLQILAQARCIRTWANGRSLLCLQCIHSSR